MNNKELIVEIISHDTSNGIVHIKHTHPDDSSKVHEDIYELKLNDGRCIKLTSNHKIKILTKERFRDASSRFTYYRKEQWKELKELSVGDYIPSIEISDNFSKTSKKEDYLYTIFGMIWGDGTMCNNSPILYVDKREKEFIENIKQNG